VNHPLCDRDPFVKLRGEDVQTQSSQGDSAERLKVPVWGRLCVALVRSRPRGTAS
jgi:hypothetical protein